jgi:hypothetical protein
LISQTEYETLRYKHALLSEQYEMQQERVYIVFLPIKSQMEELETQNQKVLTKYAKVKNQNVVLKNQFEVCKKYRGEITT